MLPVPDKAYQLFDIVEIVIIPHNALTMIDYARLFVASEAVQKLLNAVSSCKLREAPRLYLLCVETLAAASGLAFIAAPEALSDHAFPVLAPFGVFAPGKFEKAVPFAAFAFRVFAA